jgi:hypothetical protein
MMVSICPHLLFTLYATKSMLKLLIERFLSLRQSVQPTRSDILSVKRTGGKYPP